MLSTAVTKLCQAVTNQTALATIYYQQLLAALNTNQKAETYFPQTLAYINDPNEKQALLAGGQRCVQFFVGLKAPLVADLQAAGLSPQLAAAKVVRYVDAITAIVLISRG